MNWEKEMYAAAFNSGKLEAHGDVFIVHDDGTKELIFDHQEAPTPDPGPVVTEFGFHGKLDIYACRPNEHATAVIDRFKESDDKHERMAAAQAPDRFQFLDEQWSNQPGSLQNEAIYRHNHNYYFMIRMVVPLLDTNNVPIPGRWFFSLGNYNFPSETRSDRRQYIIEQMTRWMENWIIDKAAELRRQNQLTDPQNP